MRVYKIGKIILVVMVVTMCMISKGINIFLQYNFPNAFRVEESDIEDGKGELHLSKDQMYTYRLDEISGSIMLVSYQGQYLEEKIQELVIPNVIDGCVVTCIDECAIGWDENLKEITFPDDIEMIRKSSIINTPNLIEIKCAGENLKEIEEDAFPDFNGTIITHKDSLLWKYAKDNNIKVKNIDEIE